MPVNPGHLVQAAGLGAWLGYVLASMTSGMNFDTEPPVGWVIGLFVPVVIIAIGGVVEECHRK